VASTADKSRAVETWTIAVPETSAPISIWEVAGNRLRIGSQHGLLSAAAAITLTTVTGQKLTPGLQEWEFPAAEDVASSPTLSGTRTRTLPVGPGWRKPPDLLTTETCTWSFSRVGGDTLSLRPSVTVPGGISAVGTEAALQPAPLSTVAVTPVFPIAAASASASASPPPAPESASRTAPLGPAPVTTVARSATFTPPTGGQMNALWSNNTTSATMGLGFSRATVQSDGRIHAEEIGLGNILPGKYLTSLSLQCGANRAVQVQLSVFQGQKFQMSVQTSSQGQVTFQQRLDLTASSRSSLLWTLQDLTCYFSNLVITEEP